MIKTRTRRGSLVTLAVPKASLSRRSSSVKSSTQDSGSQPERSFKSFIQGLKSLSIERNKEQQKRSTASKSWIWDSNYDHRFSRIVVTVAGIPVKVKHLVLMAILILIVTGIIATIIVLTREEESAPTKPYCKTKGCLVHAWRLTDKLNTSLDPCQDFGAYVCSAWSPPEGYLQHSNSAMDDVRKSWFPVFEQILNEGSKTLRVGHKALIMYATCMGDSKQYGSNIDVFWKFLNECRLSWPDEPQTNDTSALEVLMTLALKWQVPLFFQVRVQRLAARANWRLLLEPGSLIPLMYQHHVTIKSTGAYAKYWASFFYILREKHDGNAINHERIDATIALEGDVFRRLLVAMHPPVVRPVLVPISKIGLYTRPLESEQWLHALRQTQLEPEVTSNDKLLLGDENFFQTMAELMSSYRETQLLSLIAWSCVQLLAPAVDLRLLRTRYDEGVILYRPYFCERFVETGYRLLVIALGSVSRFSGLERVAVSAKFEHLVTVATGLVNATDWLDPASRQLAAEKLSSTRLQLWPPDIFLRNDELESVYAAYPSAELPFAEYWVQTSRRAAESYRSLTDIDTLSYAVNYALPYLQYDAARGSVKLVASLDRQGLRWRPDGIFGDSFLSNASDRAFEDRDGCLEAAEKDPMDGYPTRNGSRTSVFPEIPALEVTYAAYRQSIRDGDDGRPQAMLRNISGDQVFFMTLCYMTCSRPGAVGPHTVDCNKAVSNSEAFARAFRCPQGSRMNPKKKCTFFRR
ncbi:hypothetical protein MTO96_038028 [Rhipicephalus appendiculatus]